MAISVDTVYQRVLALANKEQRGYITPQEFNLLANQAQMSIFESYFYVKNQRERLEGEEYDESESKLSKLMDMKLRPFTAKTLLTGGASGYWTYPDAYQIGEIYTNGLICRKLSANEFSRLTGSVRHRGKGVSEPIYTETPVNTTTDIRVSALGEFVYSAGQVSCDAITKPADVKWGYVVIDKKALYNANTSTDFLLHDSEEDSLVNRILELSGIVMNKIGLTQTVSQIINREQELQKI